MVLGPPPTSPGHYHEVDVALAGYLRDFGSRLPSGDHELELHRRTWRSHGQHAIREFADPRGPFMLGLIDVSGRRNAPRLLGVRALPSCDMQSDDLGAGGLSNLGRGSRSAVGIRRAIMCQ